MFVSRKSLRSAMAVTCALASCCAGGLTDAAGQTTAAGVELASIIPNPSAPPTTTARPEMTVARCETAPHIDGKLDDACWSTSTHVSGFYRLEGGIPVAQQTEAWIC